MLKAKIYKQINHNGNVWFELVDFESGEVIVETDTLREMAKAIQLLDEDKYTILF